jgi:hypothetical protein
VSAGLLSSVIAFDWLACWLELSAKTAGCQGEENRRPERRVFPQSKDG